MRTIAIAQQKGGVGKTTTACALAHGLARQGYTVTLLDLDAQGNTAICLGVKPQPRFHDVMMGRMSMAEALIEARPGLWLLPGDTSTAELKTAWAGKPYRESLLARALAVLQGDFVILDTGPGRDLLHDNAHEAAGEVIIPCAVDHLALVGVGQEFDTLRAVREHGHPVEVTAILPTFFDRTTRESAINLAKLKSTFGDLVLEPVVRTVKLREGPAYGLTVWELLPDGHEASRAYQNLIARVLHE